jgi:hypothetical protein
MTGEELRRLGKDIKMHGLRISITADKDGVLLDGRTGLRRWSALALSFTIGKSALIWAIRSITLSAQTFTDGTSTSIGKGF